jgi:hypothetical protein
MTGAQSARALGPSASVTGAGFVVHDTVPSIPFRAAVSAFQDEWGNSWGSVTSVIDLTELDLGRVTLRGPVSCLHVNGNSAWIGATVTQSSNEDIVPAGLAMVVLVRDLGGEAEDIMHVELFDSASICSAEPALPETQVTTGDFRVR